METIKQRDVSTAQDLIAAVRDRTVDRIVVSGDLAGLSSLELLPDQALTTAARATLQFKDDSDGFRLSSNNKLENLTLIAAPEKRAIFNDTTVTDLGCLELRNLTLTGAVQILAADRVRSRIVTRGNGAVGIQISQPVGEISVRRGIETFAGSGESLVKGVMTNLPAIAFSVKAGGAVRALRVSGGSTTHGSAVAPLDVEGSVELLSLKGGVTTSSG